MKESFVIYNSFYEPIKELKNEQLGKLFRAIFDYTINGVITQDKDIIVAFMFIKNQIDIDTNKWEETKKKRSEAGRLGGINRAKNQNQNLSSKSKQCLNELNKNKQSQANQAVNVNDNVNVNVLYNSSSYNNIYTFVENCFRRTLSAIEIEEIENWEDKFNEDIIKYAIKISVLNNKKNFNYVNGILNNWKTSGYKTLQEIKNNEIKKEDIEIFDYNWLEED